MTDSGSVTSFNLLSPVFRRAIHEAYDDVMYTLELEGRHVDFLSTRKISATVAHHIVEQAQHGECNVERLRNSVLSAMHFDELERRNDRQ
jgi:hypothetical protein